jgi:UDP:flavonoid glycosyltransferase YjiC (YdhE family)
MIHNRETLMKILFTTSSGLGHFHPLVPLAQAAVDAGHEVAFACPHSLAARVESTGFQAFVVSHEQAPDPERVAVRERVMQLPPGDEANLIMLADSFIGLNSRRVLPPLVELCKSWKPDVIVREDCEFAGAIAAEHLGLPHVAVQISYAFDWGHLSGTSVQERLDELRTEWGLAPDPELEMLFRYLLISFDPPSFIESGVIPPTAHHLRARPFDRSGAETALPDWLARPARLLIYATFGTEAAKMPFIYPAAYTTLLAGLREVDGTAVVTIGRQHEPAELGPQPEHIHVEQYIPQSLLLPECDLVITHGGHNTVLAALSFGLPMVVIPFFADQLNNAARCAELGVARTIPAGELSPDAVREAVQGVLGDSRYRENAMRLRAEMEALPEVEQGVRLMEKLVGERMAVGEE